MRKAAFIISLVFSVLAISTLAAQINSTSYKQNVIISAGGENVSSSSYKMGVAVSIIAKIINSTTYSNRLGFFHTWLLANSQACSSGSQCEGGFCCSNLCASSACSTSSSSSSSTSSGGGDGGGGGGIPAPLQEEEKADKDFSASPGLIKEFVALGAAKSASVKIKNAGKSKLDFKLDVSTVSDFVFLSDSSFALEPGEEKEIELNVIGKKLGSYFGSLDIEGGGITKSVDIVIEVESAQVLFDAKIDIPSAYKELRPGDELKAQITLLNVGPPRKVDVTTTYIIKDKKGKIIDEFSETFAVEVQSSFVKSFNLPDNLEPGDYIVIVELRYENSFAVSSELFRVVEEKSLIQNMKELPYSLSLLLVIAAGVTFLLVYLLMPREIFGKTGRRKKK